MSNCKNDSKALEYWRKWAKKKYIDVDSDSDARLRTLIDYEIGWLQDELEIAMDFACKMDAKNQTPERNEVDALKVHHSKLSAKILNVFPPKMTYVNDLQALDVIKREYEQLKIRFTAPIICLCGSTRFKQTWIEQNVRFTQAGYIVLSVALWGHHERKDPDIETKKKLDELHKRKIDLADSIYVLNVTDYIGESTRSEIEYALYHGKPIKYLLSEFPNYKEPIDEEIESLRAQLTASKELNRQAWCLLDIHCPNEEITDKLFNFLTEKE